MSHQLDGSGQEDQGREGEETGGVCVLGGVVPGPELSGRERERASL